MSVRSMTGFARVRRPFGDGEAILSVKSLNHRGLDPHFYLPDEFDPFESALRSVLKTKVGRGHVEIRVTLSHGSADRGPAINQTLLNAYVAAFSQAAAVHKTTQPLDLNAALRLPGMFEAPTQSEPDPASEGLLVSMLEEALDQLNEFRSREGLAIAETLRERSASIQTSVEEIARIREKAHPAFQARLEERLSELLKGAQIDPQRIVQEAAILTDRSDIGEEITRLRIHAKELEQILKRGGELGKRLDFLLQEMNREANTILSKTGGIGEQGLTITARALDIKGDIEKIREQALNLE